MDKLLSTAENVMQIKHLPSAKFYLPISAQIKQHIKYSSIINDSGGQERLPKFKFSAKFPIGLHVILELQIKTNKICLNQMLKLY